MDPENGGNEKETPPLRIDPKWCVYRSARHSHCCVLSECSFRDALARFFQPTKTDDPRLDFYTVYNKEANEYDVDYVKKYDEDLNTTLIFVRHSSCTPANHLIWSRRRACSPQSAQPLSSTFIKIFNQTPTINRQPSSVPSFSPSITPQSQMKHPWFRPSKRTPPSEVVTSTGLLFASLLISLLAAFIAMLGKQWLNRYLRHAGGSMIERCGDRQRKCDGLQRWPFHLIVESLPVMLQISLLLLGCGLCRYMMSINTPIAYTLIVLTGFGVLFYAGIVVAGASSYECPFQTPGSALLRRTWTQVGPPLTPIFFFIIDALRTLGGTIWRPISMVWLAVVKAHRNFLTLSERIQLGILRIRFCFPPIGGLDIHLPQIGLNTRPRSRNPPLPLTREGSGSPDPQEIIPWFAPNELTMIEKKNIDNARCVSWVLKNTTDPEALDAAIRLAGTIRWFENGIDAKPLYDIFVSTFDSCFGSDGMLHQHQQNLQFSSHLATGSTRVALG